MATATHLSLLVFGGSGPTGTQFIEQALSAGHTVTMVVRTPESISRRHERLRVYGGDVMDSPTFTPLMAGKDAVVSCLGARKNEPTTLYSTGIQHILSAMQAAQVRRLICISSVAVEISPKASWLIRFITRYVLPYFYGHIYEDMRRMEQVLKQSTIDWTCVRPPRLINQPVTGKYRYAINDFLENANQVRRSDLAFFMLQHLTDRRVYRAVVDVAN